MFQISAQGFSHGTHIVQYWGILSGNLNWLWFLSISCPIYTIYCNWYYTYTLTDSMSAKMYMEDEINYNYNYNYLDFLEHLMQNILCIHVTSSLFYMITTVGHCCEVTLVTHQAQSMAHSITPCQRYCKISKIHLQSLCGFYWNHIIVWYLR